MRVRSLVAGVGIALAAGPAAAQPAPFTPAQPRTLPTPLTPAVPQTPALPVAPPSVVAPPTQLAALPYPENVTPLDPGLLMPRRTATGWQVANGTRVFREVGDDEAAAKEVVRVLREQRPTDWVVVGAGRPVVEYGLQNGRAALLSSGPRHVVAVDLKSVRVDAVRGVWVVRDDATIHLNCGLHRPDAEQAAAAIRRYGFNRLGVIGTNPAAPAMTLLFAAFDTDSGAAPTVPPLSAALQEHSLTRVGIPVPGVGYFGEMVRIDPRRVEARRDGTEWVVASGPEVLARFGPAEFTARDAARVIADGRFTEFCKAGGQTFFLVNGRAPTRVPFSAVGRRFDPTALRAAPAGGRWAVTESGRQLLDAADQAEAEGLIRLVRHYGFDTLCQVGSPPRAGLAFMAKSR